MKYTHSFEQLLRTSTLLVFALSFSAFNLAASEKGNYDGPDFLFTQSEPQAQYITARQTAIVKGYEVKTAAVLGTNQNTGSVQSIVDPIDEEPDPVPLPQPITEPLGDIELLEIKSPCTNCDGAVDVKIKATMNHYPTSETVGPPASYRGFYEILTVTYKDDITSPYQAVRDRFLKTDSFPSSKILYIPSIETNHSYKVDVYFEEYPWGEYPYNKYFVETLAFTTNENFPAQCGNAVKETGEECDDGNTNNYNDGCLSSCQVCAGPGLQANVYGGKNAQCCTGLILQGGLCNVAPSTSLDVSIAGIEVRPRVNTYDPTDKYEIVVKVKNNSTTALTSYDLLRSILTLTAGTNVNDITACTTGNCRGVGNSYNAGMYLSAPSVTSIPVNGIQEYPFNQQTFLGTRPEFNNGMIYAIKAIVDDNNYLQESNEINNVLQIAYSNSAPATNTVTVCHKTGANAMIEITTDKDGWTNGHAKHEGDYLKNASLPCKIAKTPTEPLASTQGPTPSTDDRDALIKKLQERIARLEYKLSQMEEAVVEREMNREKNVDTALTDRLAGKLLLQVESVGEVWYVDPITKKKFYLKDGVSAYQALKAFGLGISEEDFQKLTNSSFAKTLRGKILLRVHSHGEAYYIDDAGVAHYLKDGNAAYELMQSNSLGITDGDLSRIATDSLGQ